MARVYEVAFKIGANMASSFAKTMSGATGALGELNKQMSEISRQQSGNHRVIDLRQSVASAAKEFNAAKQRVAELGAEMKKTDKPTKAMRQEYERAQQSVKKAHDRLEQQRSKLKEVAQQTGNTGKSTAQLVAEQNKLARSGEKAAKAQAALQKNLAAQEANKAKRGEMRGQLFDAAALAVSIGAPIKAAIEFESAMADVNKVMDFKDPETGLKNMSQAVLDMSKRLPMAAQEIAQIFALGGQSGVAEEELAMFAEHAVKMGVAFGLSAEEAGQSMAEMKSAFGMTIPEVQELTDKINLLGNTGAANEKQILSILTRVGPLGEVAGVASGEIAALGSTLAGMGIAEEVAATGIQNLMLSLVSGAAATKSQRKAFEKLGFYDPERVAKSMQENATETMRRVFKQIQKLEKHEQASVMSSLFGKESIKAIAPLLNQLDTLDENFQKVADAQKYAGAVASEYAARAETTANQLQLMKNQTAAIGITLGAVLLPIINDLLSALTPWVDKLDALIKANPELVKYIVIGTAALVAGKVAAIAFGYAWTFVKGALLAARGVLLAMRAAMVVATGAQWLFNAAMTANPIGLVVMAIAGLIAAGVALYKNWDTVTAFFGKAWELIKNLFMTFHPLGWIMGGMQPLMDFLNQWGLVDLFSSKFNAVKDWLLSFSLFDSGAKLLTTLSDGIKSAVSAPVEAIKGALAKVREYLPFSDAKLGPLSDLTYSGMQILSTISEGIKAAIDNPVEAIKGALSKVREYLPFSDAKIGPLSELTLSGSRVMSTLAEGMSLSANDPAFAADNALADVANGLTSFANRGGGGAQTSNSIVINLNQEVNVNGAGADVYSQAKQGATDGARDLINDLTRALSREGRLSYG